LQAQLIVGAGKYDKHDCKNEFLDKKFNACRIKGGFLSTIFLGYLEDKLMKAFNFEPLCPYNPGLYEMKNFSLVFPSTFLPGIFQDGSFCIKVIVFGKVGKSTANEMMFNTNITLDIKT
jgi:hypothetical protein